MQELTDTRYNYSTACARICILPAEKPAFRKKIQRSAFISINLQYNSFTCRGMALAWRKIMDLFGVH